MKCKFMSCKFMLSAFPRLQKKYDTNLDPRSEVTCLGMPCLEKTWMTKSSASWAEVIVLWVGMNIPCLNRRSTHKACDAELLIYCN